MQQGNIVQFREFRQRKLPAQQGLENPILPHRPGQAILNRQALGPLQGQLHHSLGGVHDLVEIDISVDVTAP